MAHQWLRCNLGVAIFPFATSLWGRSIIVPGQDTNFDRVTEQNVPNKDRGIPQVFYMHNVVPTGQGYQSIGYNSVLPPNLTGQTDFDNAMVIRYTSPEVMNGIFVPAIGKNYVWDETVGNWASVSPITPGTLSSTTLVTTAYINGTTYIYYERYGCFKYDPTTKTMLPVTLAGLTPTNILGILSANGYLVAFSETDIAWSSLSDPEDFVPSLVTGSGGGTVQFTKGRINFGVYINGGFILYCEGNTVSATYSGNVRFPYIFSEVANSGGCRLISQVSWSSNQATHFAWTTSGLQEVSKTSAINLVPEVTDFLTMKLFEDFDETTLTLSQQTLSSQLNLAVAVVGDRYLIISYGVAVSDFTHALLFDLALKRWGKLKIQHRSCFEWPSPNLYGEITYDMLSRTTYDMLALTTYDDLSFGVESPTFPRTTIAFLQADGTVQTVNFDFAQTNANGVFILGKFQFQRNKYMEHQLTEVETIGQNNDFSFKIINSLDGKTLSHPVDTVELIKAPELRRYGKRITGVNFSGLCLGAFNLTSYLIDFTLGGDVR